METTVLVEALTTFGHALPTLIACAVALSMVLSRARSAAGRKLAVTGAAMMLAATLLRLAAGVGQSAYYRSEAFSAAGASHSQFFAMIGGVYFLLSIIDGVGLALLAWGYCKAASDARGQPAPPR